MLLARSNYKFFPHCQRGNCSRVSIAGLSPKPPFLRKGQLSQTFAAESREVKMSHRGAVAVGEFPVEFCKTKFRPRSWKRKNKDSRIPWESTMRWTLPVTQDTAPQTRLSHEETINASLLSSLFLPVDLSAPVPSLLGKHHRPPGLNPEVFLRSVLIPLVKPNICYVLGTVLAPRIPATQPDPPGKLLTKGETDLLPTKAYPVTQVYLGLW